MGEVARSVGVSVRTLHHWESVGLVLPSGRRAKRFTAHYARRALGLAEWLRNAIVAMHG